MANADATAIFIDGQSNRRRSVEVRAGVQLDILENGAVIAS